MSSNVRAPAVRQVRGPYIRLEPHPDHCETEAALSGLCQRIRRMDPDAVLAADLFCGAGGLSLGLEQAGIHVVLGADHDREALETHRHHVRGMAIDWDLGDADVIERVARVLRSNRIDVLAGGPPCQPFSKAGRSGMRHLVREGMRDPHDKRRDLWRSYLEVARLARPSAVIMENVPDMALDREMFILRSMVFELERLGYSVQQRVVDAWRYGVPQFRQRLILVAVRDGSPFAWPQEDPRKITVQNAISDLPQVEGGWRPKGGVDGFATYDGPRTSFQQAMREGVSEGDRAKVYDHITRPVRQDDERAFELLDAESRYSDLPDELKRYRDDIFDDKYKRLSDNDVSRTITAHIAKDGYWYIHPKQNRTLTVREAARLQTFPDWFRFAGPPSAAFRQVGNAVPPRLGAAIGRGVLAALSGEGDWPPSSERLSSALANWFRARNRSSTPWLHGSSPWHVILGELVLDRLSTTTVSSIWPLLATYATPRDATVDTERLTEILSWVDRADRAQALVEVARILCDRPFATVEDLDALVADHIVPQAVALMAQLVITDSEEPVVATAGALRVVTRFQANPLGRKNRNSDGRLAVAKVIGFGTNARIAQLALIELGNEVCTPTDPRCDECPLAAWCAAARRY